MNAKMVVTAKVDQVINDRIGALAERLGLSKSEVVELSLLNGLVEGETFAKRLENPAWRVAVRCILAIDQSDPEATTLVDKMMRHVEKNRKSEDKRARRAAT
jgi:hypothetical protein